MFFIGHFFVTFKNNQIPKKLQNYRQTYFRLILAPIKQPDASTVQVARDGKRVISDCKKDA